MLPLKYLGLIGDTLNVKLSVKWRNTATKILTVLLLWNQVNQGLSPIQPAKKDKWQIVLELSWY